MIFFEPTPQFVDWLVEYAAGRMIFDVGCGDGYLLRLLVGRGQKALGIEPFWYEKEGFDIKLPVMPMAVQSCSVIRRSPGLVIIARPDHGGWVEWVPHNAHPDSEVLYISKPSNAEVDFGGYELVKLKAPRCPVEAVYRIDRTNMPFMSPLAEITPLCAA